jgi:hypothetical protein
MPPLYDEKPVAFVYFVRDSDNNFEIFFDFSPNLPRNVTEKADLGNERVCEGIAKFMQKKPDRGSNSCSREFSNSTPENWALDSSSPFALSFI